jgi:hypothetical protein
MFLIIVLSFLHSYFQVTVRVNGLDGKNKSQQIFLDILLGQYCNNLKILETQTDMWGSWHLSIS